MKNVGNYLSEEIQSKVELKLIHIQNKYKLEDKDSYVIKVKIRRNP